MRRVRLAAVAIGGGAIIGAALGGSALAVDIGPGNTFPASRIQVDPRPATVDMAPATSRQKATTSVTAIVEDWHGKTVPNVQVSFAIVSGPNAGRSLPSSKTNADGRASVTYASGAEPGIDAVQATFTDGLELHKSNRHFVLWRSGPQATAIRSPATITVTPNCFQPSGTTKLSSDVLRTIAPKTTPKPSATSPPDKGSPTVAGDNFNPFSAVLITFDAGFGGTPQSFEAKTDGFGHFSQTIQLTEPAEGLHLIRADDFRQREADDANYQIPCFQPSVALNPPIGPPGFVTFAVGTGFPPNKPIVDLNWASPDLLSHLAKNMQTDASGSFRYPVLVFYHDILGPRTLQAIVANPFGEAAGAAIEADAPFLVTLGRSQPSDFVERR
jgi:hypothetical protein